MMKAENEMMANKLVHRVLATEKTPKTTAFTPTPCSLSLVLCFISLHSISSPALHYNNYLFPVGPWPQRRASPCPCGGRHTWDMWSCWDFLESSMSNPAELGRQTPEMKLTSWFLQGDYCSFCSERQTSVGSGHCFRPALHFTAGLSCQNLHIPIYSDTICFFLY